MPTFSDVAQPGGTDCVPRIERSDVHYLWYSDFWDGPISGLLEYRGERLWFEMLAENESCEGWYRRFAVVRLTAEQLAEERRWHELFRRCVGTHTDYDEPDGGEVHSRETFAEFYDAYQQRTPLDISRNDVLGWIEV